MASTPETEHADEGSKPEAKKADPEGSDAPAAPAAEAAKEKPSAPAAKAATEAAGAAKPASPRPQEPRPAGGRFAIILVVAVALVLGFVILRRDDHPEPAGPAPRDPSADWTVGQDVDVELTVLPSDEENLSCAATEEVAGRRCAFTKPDEPWQGDGGALDDKHKLKPYATTGTTRLLGAGLWSEPALRGKRPESRFKVRCKYTIEGKFKQPGVRWGSTAPWKAMRGDWYSGLLSECTIKGK